MTQSSDPLIISGMTERNAPLERPVRGFLDRLIADKPSHARFLNMLSMLEHMGSRKIMVSQMNRQETLEEDTLKHLAEEARHAYFFKRQAERAAGKALDGWTDQNTHARIPALMYFGRLDAGISKQVPAKDAYQWVSLIIELRACWLYKIYHEALEASDYTLSLKSLIAEEDGHLEEMYAACGADTEKLRELCAYETQLFEKLWQKIEREADEGENEAARAA